MPQDCLNYRLSLFLSLFWLKSNKVVLMVFNDDVVLDMVEVLIKFSWFSVMMMMLFELQMCPKYKMYRDENVWHPPLQTKSMGQNGPYFGGRSLVGFY